MIRRVGLLVFCVVVLVGISCRAYYAPGSSAKEHNRIKQWPAHRIASCIRDSQCQEKFIVAHRGLGFGAPENSKEALRRAVAAGVPIVEIDVRLSKDGELFVLHDSSLKRTTNGTGKLAEKTSQELAGVFLENSEQIPTLAEIYDIARGHATLYLDIKGNVVQKIADWVAQYGSFDNVIFCVNGEGEIAAAARAKKHYPLLIVAAQAYSRKDLALIKQYFPHLPEIIDIGLPTQRTMSWLPQGPKMYASSLVLEIGLPFLKPTWRWYMSAWDFDLLETNNPLFWMDLLDDNPPLVFNGGVFL